MALWTSRKRVPARTGPSVSCTTSSASCQADSLVGSVTKAKTSLDGRAISTVVLAMGATLRRPRGARKDRAQTARRTSARDEPDGAERAQQWHRASTALPLWTSRGTRACDDGQIRRRPVEDPRGLQTFRPGGPGSSNTDAELSRSARARAARSRGVDRSRSPTGQPPMCQRASRLVPPEADAGGDLFV
jgi:hypothetical protein